ncbi:hypothetical protein QVD99_008641 [Batrachochytrium dendrobatidis]|nr:hypothetical protein O5D80_001264 [Batrachochytrium dendrobatidis]KAK5664582.1 hypothetical protein QVD99_008641 [Batrachochytrium dendrobatidis]
MASSVMMSTGSVSDPTDIQKPKGRIIVATHHLPWIICRSGNSLPSNGINPGTGKSNHVHHSRGLSIDSVATSSSSDSGYGLKSSLSTANSDFIGPGLTYNTIDSVKNITSELNAPTEPVDQESLLKPKAFNSEWTLKSRPGHSALFSGVHSLSESGANQVVHVGWLGHVPPSQSTSNANPDPVTLSLTPQTPEETVQQAKQMLWSLQSCVPVLLDDNVATNHYKGYCKLDLWPLFHYIPWDDTKSTREGTRSWPDYVTVNEQFAETIIQIYQPGDIIWVHDYHLLLVPSMIRKALPTAIIGFFLHTPFPSSEIFRSLPRRKEILSGLLGSNLIGFQTYAHARHFNSSCIRVLGCESSPTGVEFHGFTVSIGIFPIGIDVQRVQALCRKDSVSQKAKSIRDLFPGKRIIMGRDKFDHIKGILHKLHSFEKFLQLFPEWHNKVTLIQITSPPHRSSPSFASKISETISRINGTYGSLEYAPVHHYHQILDEDEYYALLNIADMSLITSLRDGMNTSSHEFVVCQHEQKAPLILSEFTGTAGSMSGAYLVNPWDHLGVANAINDALLLSIEDRAIKHKQLYDHVTRHTAQFWASSFIKELCSISQGTTQQTPTPIVDTPRIINSYTHAQRRLLMFDYDGTLTPIKKVPNAALPPPDMLKAMQILVQDPKNVVFVISGRDQACLDTWLGHIDNLGLSAEHGSFIKYPGGKWINLATEIDLNWKAPVAEIFNFFTERTLGSFVEHKRYAITWHYRLADPDYGTFQAKECQMHLENAILSKLPVEILLGKKNLEVRPISMNKGEIVKRLVQQQLQNQPPCDFVYCVGDDRTDEDMFKALKKSELNEDTYFTCTIGSATKHTHAQWHVNAPQDVIDLIGAMADVSLKN